jgi:hypothetical protein
VAAILAAAGDAWPDAETHFETTLRTAVKMPHRVEQSEVRFPSRALCAVTFLQTIFFKIAIWPAW